MESCCISLPFTTVKGCSGPRQVTPTGAPPSSNPFDRAIFHRCYAGDTCTFTIRGVPDIFEDYIAIRLVGIDAPHIKGQCQREKEPAMHARDLSLSSSTMRAADFFPIPGIVDNLPVASTCAQRPFLRIVRKFRRNVGHGSLDFRIDERWIKS